MAAVAAAIGEEDHELLPRSAAVRGWRPASVLVGRHPEARHGREALGQRDRAPDLRDLDRGVDRGRAVGVHQAEEPVRVVLSREPLPEVVRIPAPSLAKSMAAPKGASEPRTTATPWGEIAPEPSRSSIRRTTIAPRAVESEEERHLALELRPGDVAETSDRSSRIVASPSSCASPSSFRASVRSMVSRGRLATPA